MISIRLFLIFSFIVCNCSVPFLHSSAFQKECMPGKSLAHLLEKEKDQKLAQTRLNEELIRRHGRLESKRDDYRYADYKYNLKDLEQLNQRIKKAEEKVAHQERQIKEADIKLFNLRECIVQRGYNHLPVAHQNK